MYRMLSLLMVACLLVGCAQTEVKQSDHKTLMQESRGVWLEKAQMIEGKEALSARLDRLKESGFNSIYMAMQVRGCVMYPGSEILPQWEDAATQDPKLIEWIIDEVHKRGMIAEAWTEFGFYTYHTPDAEKDPSRGAVLAKYPDLVAIDSDGNTYLHNKQWGDFFSLCPSNPKSQQVLSDLYFEMMRRFDFDGLNLDRIRYPTGDFCFCPYCREHFEKDTGIALSAFPEGTKEHQAFIDWRKQQLIDFMQRFSTRFRTEFPGVKITSAVVPPEMIDEKGQDWMTWMNRGYLDAAMPMLYSPKIGGSVKAICERVRRDDCIFYGLDAGQGFDVLSGQITDLRHLNARGLTVWYSGSVDPMLPQVKELLGGPAVSPLYE